MRGEDAAELKILKDYAPVKEELYRRMPGGVLSRCMGQKEAERKLKEVHDKTCGSCGEVNLYRRFKGQASTSRVWVKMQIKSKPSVGPASLRQTEMKATPCSSVKTGEAHSYNS